MLSRIPAAMVAAVGSLKARLPALPAQSLPSWIQPAVQAVRPELEQAVLRLAIATAICAYVVWYVDRGGVASVLGPHAIGAATCFLLFSVAMVALVIQKPAKS